MTCTCTSPTQHDSAELGGKVERTALPSPMKKDWNISVSLLCLNGTIAGWDTRRRASQSNCSTDRPDVTHLSSLLPLLILPQHLHTLTQHHQALVDIPSFLQSFSRSLSIDDSFTSRQINDTELAGAFCSTGGRIDRSTMNFDGEDRVRTGGDSVGEG